MDLPLVAYGTSVEHSKDFPLIKERVKTAISLGYTHIDTATTLVHASQLWY